MGVGARLGPYEIVSAIGAGGMGEVYRARDTRLERDVAVKVLPPAFVQDPDRLARFEREAKSLAALNHPNIATIHGVEERDGTRAIVMELVDGDTVADRIAQGPLPLEEALTIAKQIAQALEAAHEQGIIHRDLKPANIKVRPNGTVKVLDFGLAKLTDPAPAAAGSASASLSPTVTSPAMMTGVGVLLGTAAYMAPEQAKGRAADQRSDVWAFGCVLYEMLSGRRPFAADDVTETLAAVLMREPDWGALPPATPEALRTLLARCLRKDPRRRVAHIADARLEIEDALAAPPQAAATDGVRAAPERSRWRVAAMVACFVGGALVAVPLWQVVRQPSTPDGAITRFTLQPPGDANRAQSLALAPDGSRLVLAVDAGVGTQLFMRAFDDLTPVLMRGTEGASQPFFSPDGQWVGFSAEQKLKRVPTAGGAALTITDAATLNGASWGGDGTIVFARGLGEGLWRVPAAGGTAVQLVRPDRQSELNFSAPEVLPGDRAVLYTVVRAASPRFGINALQLDTGETRRVLEDGSNARYLPTGHLLFFRSDVPFIVPFDLGRLEPRGTPVAVADSVGGARVGGVAQLAVSNAGTMAYIHGDVAVTPARRLAWVDRRGNVAPAGVEERPFEFPRLAPDGNRLAVDLRDGEEQDIWIYHFARGTLTRFTFGPNQDETALWSADGSRIAYAADRAEGRVVLVKRADGGGAEQVLATDKGHLHLHAWSPDGNIIAMDRGGTGGDILLLRVPDRKIESFVQTSFDERDPDFSPDGRWMAYASDESGRLEVYVRAFPGPSGQWQISTGGGREPRWTSAGRELVYRNGQQMLVVDIRTRGDALEAGAPRVLFEGTFEISGADRHYDVTPDGQRFLMLLPDARGSSSSHVVVVQNWFEELKRLVPVN